MPIADIITDGFRGSVGVKFIILEGYTSAVEVLFSTGLGLTLTANTRESINTVRPTLIANARQALNVLTEE